MTQKIQRYLIRLGAEIAILGHEVKGLKARQKIHKLLLDYLFYLIILNTNIKMSSFKSSKNIQKKEGGADRSVSDNQLNKNANYGKSKKNTLTNMKVVGD